MNIIEMNITNVKRIVAVHIEPETGDHVVLTGDNGQGKSSILDAVYLALTNKGLEDPIRHGTSRASIKLHIDGAEGNFWIERNISRKSNTLRVYPENGEDIKAPQRFLDGLIGTLAFDPLEFMRMDAEHQAEMIRRLVGIDTTAIDQEYATLYAQRTQVGRDRDEAQAQLKALTKPEIPPVVEEPEQTVTELLLQRDQLAGLMKVAVDAGKKAVELINAARTAAELVSELEGQLRDAKQALTRAEEVAKHEADVAEKAKENAIAAGGSPKMEEINTKIANVDQTNAEIRARREAYAAAVQANNNYSLKVQAVNKASGRYDEMSDRLDALQEKKIAVVREAKMPIEGMTFDQDGVFINSVRLDQMSTAEQIRISAAVAMSVNPKLKIILIKEGALLNKANLKIVFDFAKEHGFQIFMEKFQEEPGNEGLHIIDGAIAYVDGVKLNVPDPTPEPPSTAPETVIGSKSGLEEVERMEKHFQAKPLPARSQHAPSTLPAREPSLPTATPTPAPVPQAKAKREQGSTPVSDSLF